MKIEITLDKKEFINMLRKSAIPIIPLNSAIIDLETRGYPDKEFVIKLESIDKEVKQCMDQK